MLQTVKRVTQTTLLRKELLALALILGLHFSIDVVGPQCFFAPIIDDEDHNMVGKQERPVMDFSFY